MTHIPPEPIRTPEPQELFDRGLALFARGQVEESVAVLRRAFFGNVFVAPMLLGSPLEDFDMSFAAPSATPEAARRYCSGRREAWQEVPHALRYLRCLWEDPLVRREVQSYINFCKSYSRSDLRSERVLARLAAEREKFANERRIRSTQKEILERIRRFRFDIPPPRPRVECVTLQAPDTEEAKSFFERLLGLTAEPDREEGRWRFRLGNLDLLLLPGPQREQEPELTLVVDQLRYYVRRAEEWNLEVLGSETERRRGAYLVAALPGCVRLRLIQAAREEGD